MVSDEAIGSLLEVTNRPAGPRDIRRIFAGRDAPQTACRETRQPLEALSITADLDHRDLQPGGAGQLCLPEVTGDALSRRRSWHPGIHDQLPGGDRRAAFREHGIEFIIHKLPVSVGE
jgi:hypothetical protein